jgi:EPS-associated MarR family transcriptional regulator
MNTHEPKSDLRAHSAPDPADGMRLAVLRVLEQNPSTTQRELSRAIGLSLGKTHYVLHALLDRGLVKAENFRRSGNKLAYVYLLTPSGIRHRAMLTRRFLRQKETEFEALQRTLAQLRSELRNGIQPN